MAKRLGEWVRRRRFLVLVVAIIVAVGTLVAAVTVFWWKPHIGPVKGTTIPLVDGTETSGEVTGVVAVSPGDSREDEAGDGQFAIRLSQGQAEFQEVAFLPPVSGDPLSDEEIAQILARLPALTAEPEDQVDLNLPEDSPPPPRTGETIEEPFPPPEPPVLPEQVEAGPLEVLRFGPEGEIPLAPFCL